MRVVRQIAKKVITKYIYNSTEASFSKRVNRFGPLVGWRVKVFWNQEKRMFSVKENDCVVHLARKSRLRLYAAGVKKRLSLISKEYHVDEVSFKNNDVVIDVGANIGEFSLALSSFSGVRVVAIEPEEREFLAMKENLLECDCELYNTVLWKDSEDVDFYAMNESGDSSIFQQCESTKSSRVSAITLDDLAKTSDLIGPSKQIKLLKLEAEGAEPEILEGAKDIIHRIEYVSADVGAERGMEHESTLIPVQEKLMDWGFVPIKFGLPRAVMLFKNKRLLNDTGGHTSPGDL